MTAVIPVRPEPTDRPLTRYCDPKRKPLGIVEASAGGRYFALRHAVTQMTPQEVAELVTASGLRGRGGAGFPTGTKWGLLSRTAPHPRYLIVNGDEMEPGTFKDRYLLENDPHGIVEGALVAAYAIQASTAYIFLRGEYYLSERRVKAAIAEAIVAGFAGKNICGSGWSCDVVVHMSGGRYICGEETALINALEGRRANPRAKPPFPTVVGLFGQPTIVNNVETLYNVPHIVAHGAEWWKGLARSPEGGTKMFGVSGKVKRPGTWELPLGTPVREVIEVHAGGMRDGVKLRGFLPGGAGTDFLTTDHLDLAADYETIRKAGSRLGTATMILLDDQTDVVGMVLNLTKFFAQESCGFCTPCRDGLPRAEQILRAIVTRKGLKGDVEDLQSISRLWRPGLTHCALAPGAAEPLDSAIKYFREDFERWIASSTELEPGVGA